MKTTLLCILALFSSHLFAQFDSTTNNTKSILSEESVKKLPERNSVSVICGLAIPAQDTSSTYHYRCHRGIRDCCTAIIVEGVKVDPFKLPNTSIDREDLPESGIPAYMSDANDNESNDDITHTRNIADVLKQNYQEEKNITEQEYVITECFVIKNDEHAVYKGPEWDLPIDSSSNNKLQKDTSKVISAEAIKKLPKRNPQAMCQLIDVYNPSIDTISTKLDTITVLPVIACGSNFTCIGYRVVGTCYYIDGVRVDSLSVTKKEVDTFHYKDLAKPSTYNFNPKLYPNPTNQSTTLSFDNDYKEAVNIEITDVNGRVHYQKNNFTGNSLLIETEVMAAGVYFVKVIKQNPTGEYKAPTLRLVIY